MMNSRVMKAGQLLTMNDEVAKILRGLKLDKAFFADRIRPEALQELKPTIPFELDIDGQIEEGRNSRAQHKRDSIRRSNRKKLTVMKVVTQRNTDFDIYLNEAVMPVLAQALDALCRQLTKMKQQGDCLDPKVRERFNPLTWLGQQLLRRHPKCARTPRRQLLYKGFKDWADWEKGRREMLRTREDVQEVFGHFMLRGGVSYETIWDVLVAVDDTLKLDGCFKNNREIQRAMQGQNLQGASLQWKDRFQNGVLWTFEEFWYHLANTLMMHEVVPYSVLARGAERKSIELKEQQEWMEKVRMAEDEKSGEEELKRHLTQEYAVLYQKLMANPQIQSMINEGKILTGDYMRQGDIGYEYEVMPHGDHIQLLAEFLILLGLESAKKKEEEVHESAIKASQSPSVFRASAKAKKIEGAKEEERYWDDGLSSAWAMLQKVHHVELCDGVVDGEVLKQVLVPPVGFNLLRGKVEYEMERKADNGQKFDDDGLLLQSDEKPTKEQLASRLGMTISRLEWLHKLFESFLQPDVPGGLAPVCLYPECPASLNKEQMRALVSEVEPHLSHAQFDARFKRLDSDGSGLIEFDEFAAWVHSSDVRVAGASTIKMTFEEIANRYQETVELISYLHSCFQDQMPDGVIDGYPSDPAGLSKQEAKFLAGIITPGFDPVEFDDNFDVVDAGSRQKGFCDFDEWVELLELDDLPAELRDRFEDEN